MTDPARLCCGRLDCNPPHSGNGKNNKIKNRKKESEKHPFIIMIIIELINENDSI